MIRRILCYGLLLLMGLTACSRQPDKDMEPGNSVYYWRTDLRIDSTERAFLRTYDIKKVYCRYFDVVQNDTATGPVPNATMTFSDSIPEGVEIIPTVYITEDCMHRWHKGLAEKLVRRIRQMNETNDITGVSSTPCVVRGVGGCRRPSVCTNCRCRHRGWTTVC